MISPAMAPIEVLPPRVHSDAKKGACKYVKTAETGNMPYFPHPCVIEICIQLALIKHTTAPCTPVIVLAEAMNLDNSFPDILDRIETAPMPLHHTAGTGTSPFGTPFPERHEDPPPPGA